MTALTRARAKSDERWTHHHFRLKAGTKAYQNGKLGIELGTGKVVPMTADDNLLYIGTADSEVDATAAEAEISVNLGLEIEVIWFNNDTDAPLLATDLGGLAFSLDDQTVSANGGALAGRVWAVDATDGVAVQKLDQAAGLSGGGRIAGAAPTLPAWNAGNSAVLDVRSGSRFDIPTTTGASTVTLPDAAEDGDLVYFSADGVKNAHTVQYRQGATLLTTALTASKRHLVVALFLAGTWRANAYVSP